MKAQLECYSCNIRQAQEATMIAGKDQSFAWLVSQAVCRVYSKADPGWTPAYMTTVAHRIAIEMTETHDIYANLKQHYNHMALELYPRLKSFVATGNDRVERAIRVAIAGNIIDLGVYQEIRVERIMEEVEGSHWGIYQYDELRRSLDSAKHILYVGDNAGEIVFDRVFLEEIVDGRECTFLVKSGPISNDALLEDARVSGIDTVSRVMETGKAEIGFSVEHSSCQVQEIWNTADLIISKGQGNFETLSDRSEAIFYLLKAKCLPVARELNVDQGDLILKKSIS